MGRCDIETFLTELSKLYDATKKVGSVWVTMKRCIILLLLDVCLNFVDEPKNSKKDGKGESKETAVFCLVRAVDGKDFKISTLVFHFVNSIINKLN
jgi:hypothetical protein